MGATKDTDIFLAIADPMRRSLLEQLRDGPRTATELAGRLGLSARAVATLLNALREAGWLRSDGDGDTQVHASVPETQERLIQWASSLLPERGTAPLPVDTVEMRARGHEKEWPGRDADTYRIGQRLLRLSTHVERSLREIAGSVNLLGAELLMLDALRLGGAPYAASPSQLQKMLAMTGGGITKCIDRLELMSLVKRQADPSDGRGVVVSMTHRAHALLEGLVAQGHLGIDSAAAARLPARRRALLARLLHELVVLADAELAGRAGVDLPRVHKPRLGRPSLQSAAAVAPARKRKGTARD